MEKGHRRLVSAFARISVLLLLIVWMVGCGGKTSNSSNNNNSGSSGTGTPTAGSSNPGSGGGGTGGGSTSSANYVYLADATEGGGAFGFKLDSSGTLTPVAGSPFKVSGSTDASYGPVAVANGFVYVATFASAGGPGQLFTFQIDPNTGALTQKGSGVAITGTSFTAVGSLRTSVDKSTIYALTQQTITAIATNNGSPTELNMQTVTDGSIFGFAAGNGVAYVGIQDGNPKTGFKTPVIKRITLGANGSLQDAGTVVATLTTANIPNSLALDPTGKYVAATTGMNSLQVAMYSVGSNGTLSEVQGSPFNSSNLVGFNLKFDPSGKFLYEVANNEADPNDETLVVFSVGSNGALTQVQTLPNGNHEHAIGLLVTSGYVLVSNLAAAGQGGIVTVFSRDASSGKLTLTGTQTVNRSTGEVGTTAQ
ncbi:MAG TPA: beta-propeller fold lactonase family protein [Terriglobales bacterium]|nr:beta-propeller fold lactonase family protein [Terriglobales bacterium]